MALIGTTTLVDTPASYDTLLAALSDFGTQSQHPELASIPILFVGHSQVIMPGQPHGPQGEAGRYYREDVRRFMATHLLGDDARDEMK